METVSYWSDTSAIPRGQQLKKTIASRSSSLAVVSPGLQQRTCHGSRFAATGEVLSGPAEKPLKEVTPAGQPVK